MALTKQKKQEIIEKLTKELDGVNSVAFVSFTKFTVADTIVLRRALRAEDVGYMVVKKTLLKRVLDQKGISGQMPDLPGEIAIAYGADLLAPARLVYEFYKDHKEVVEIVGGIFEGGYKSKEEMNAIATIPPRETLLTQFAFLLKSPLQRLAVGLGEVAKKKA